MSEASVAAGATCNLCGDKQNAAFTWPCQDCGDPFDACRDCHKDAKLCEDCQGRYLWCSVCLVHQHEDGGCRHVFYDDDYQEAGAGGYEQDFEAGVHAFLRWLRSLPDGDLWGLRGVSAPTETDIIHLVRRTISEGRFSTFLSGPMMGCPTVQLMEWRKQPSGEAFGGSLVYAYGESLAEFEAADGDESKTGSAMDGFHWLQSLFCGDAPEANALTVRWIDSFLEKEVADV